MTEKIIIEVPKKLKKKLEKKLKETNFKSIQEYILYFLEQIVFDSKTEEVYTKEETAAFHANPAYDEDMIEEKALKENLKKLGYLN